MQEWFKKLKDLEKFKDVQGIADLSKILDNLPLENVTLNKIPLPSFGEQLRDFRTLRGKSVDDLATEVGITPMALRDIESGKRSAPSESTVIALANALQLGKDDRETLVDSAELSSPMLRKILGKEKSAPGQTTLTAAILVFLIADIRGYTRFTQEHGDAAAARLTTRFSELAHTIADQYDGRIVEVRGDEVLAVFASARQALHAAHMLQARCAEEAVAHPDLPLAIGVGMDVGEPIPMEDGGYRGAALNRAARLCGIAGPGDVLVSTGVAYIAPQVDGITYVHRGEEQLKGIAEPTPVLLAARTEVTDADQGATPGE
ncbi:MAG TPA: helix-turn-helix domain-containing protein [Ktedonobacterales bacterium]|nr:helix-turn-helix domain-containing protein [Ktedonobacterales bacterium]